MAEGRRGQGIGTLALRHAMREGCRLSVAPASEEARRLLASHGWARADGGYDLCPVSWPGCRPYAPGGAAEAA